jgi:hypothetical protein
MLKSKLVTKVKALLFMVTGVRWVNQIHAPKLGLEEFALETAIAAPFR